jgi:hypothetical protein
MLAIEVADVLDASIALLVLILALFIGYKWLRILAIEVKEVREAVARIEGRLNGVGMWHIPEPPPPPIDLPVPPKTPPEEAS